jgi:hypothetical protein
MVRRIVVLLAVVAVMGGCAAPGKNNVAIAAPGNGSDSVGYGPVGLDCDSDGHPTMSTPPLTPLPADAVLVSATRCLFESRPVAGDGEWMYRIEQRADSGLDGLAAALRLPSEQAGAGVGYACPAIGYIPTVITVTDTKGHQIHPELPHAACGGPLPAASKAIGALPWHTTAEKKLHQTQTELETSSGCPGGYKPVVALIGAEQHPDNHKLNAIDTSVSPLRVCQYQPDPKAEIDAAGITLHIGRLVAASTLDAAKSRALLTKVAAAPVATAACSEDVPFAVVGTKDHQGFVTVETGGCYRALVDTEDVVRQLDPSTVHQIFG